YLQYDFGAPEEIYGYNFIPQNITYHTPMVWYVAGSNDGSAWTTIETGAHSGVWTEGEQYESLFASPQTYRYFRFIVTENLTNYAWCITEMEILGLPSVFGN
ncbi:MAG: discoidin domain-containing protein, partial [Desulfobacteraceae bacterium]|nr:discoidin domain-containing protein [Desulfobacteraceae bacterium]